MRFLTAPLAEGEKEGERREACREREKTLLFQTDAIKKKKVKTSVKKMLGAAPASAVETAAALSLQSFPRAPPSPSLDELSLHLGLSYDAVASIYSQGAQLAAAGPHARARREAGSIAEKFAASIIGDSSTSTSSSSFKTLDALSSAARVPAALLLRRVLEAPPFNVPRTAVTDFMRCPRAFAAARAKASSGGGATTAAAAGASQPPPPSLLAAAADAAAAASALDPLYSPRGDALRHVAGAEAEALLCARLRSAGGGGGGEGEREENGSGNGNGNENSDGHGSRGVPFWTEGALRAGGFALTPDVRLATPVALPCGHVVHWIDSKATFGTVRMHE